MLVEAGLATSRTAAQRMIAAGRVSWSGGLIKKPALDLAPETTLTVAVDPEDRFVSRGGLKLAGALAETGITVTGKHCLDVGQSTGGFSDCLLQAGARHVVGVDVGHGQLHRQLFGEPRLTAIEGINCRTLSAADLGPAYPAEGFGLIVGDVSFISMTLILPQLPALLANDGDLLLLVKPQFEVGSANIGKGGIVRDPALYGEVENKLRQCAANLGLQVRAWLDSPITGGDGNREFFIWLNK
ncbi:hemolysin [Dechloromonas denitrificans]|uniref:Hemolysin n=1 Tax=Dechloromonas denitrificans TaxID=281362 RepID=A0A133XI34_9RHOO|nr:hemolysin [Dechloromonas denitrificans]